MDGVKPKSFSDAELGTNNEAEPKPAIVTDGEAPPKKRKSRHKKFIDLQKQPPKPAPLVQE
jgi:hypothetical protein